MKKAISILLTAFFIFSGLYMPSFAAREQGHTVYVATREIPKAASKFARKYFSEQLMVNYLCSRTGLTIEQGQRAKLGPAFRMETYDFENAARIYYFPILLEDKFIAMGLVFWNSSGYYQFQLEGRNDANQPLLDALNTLPSGPAAPLMFITTQDGYFVRDSKGGVKLLYQYILSDAKRLERQQPELAKLALPGKVTATGAAHVFPEKISSRQEINEEPVLTVKNETKRVKYTSSDGGRTWTNNAKPPVHISIRQSGFPQKDGRIPYTVHNNTAKELNTDEYFSLKKWNGQKWVTHPESGSLEFPDIGIVIVPNGASDLTAWWERSKVKLEKGDYKLIKVINIDGEKFTCEADFSLV